MKYKGVIEMVIEAPNIGEIAALAQGCVSMIELNTHGVTNVRCVVLAAEMAGVGAPMPDGSMAAPGAHLQS
jgi:hypothetical protein